MRRFRIIEFLPGYPFLVARVSEIGNAEALTPEVEARTHLLRERAREALQLLPNVPAEVGGTIDGLTAPSALADFVAGIVDSKAAEKQDVLETLDVKARLDKVIGFLISIEDLHQEIFALSVSQFTQPFHEGDPVGRCRWSHQNGSHM